MINLTQARHKENILVGITFCHAPKVMARKEHLAKIYALQTLSWQLEAVKKHDITFFNARLYSRHLISLETKGKNDIASTLSDVKGRLDCNEEVFDKFINVLSQTPDENPDLASELRSCYEEKLKDSLPVQESVDMPVYGTTPTQVT